MQNILKTSELQIQVCPGCSCSGRQSAVSVPVSLGMSINYYFYFQVLVAPATDAESV